MAVSKKVATRNIQTIKIQGHINSFKYQDNDLGTIAITIPRSEIYDTFTENELFHNCLYFLFGNNGNKEVAYVGQAKKRNSNESVLNRIREHDKKEEESYNEKWNNVVIVTNKNDVCALEKAFFIEIGKDNRLNTQTPNYGGDDFERFMTKIEQVKLLITAIGFNMFSEKTNVDNVQITPDYNNFNVEDLHNWGSTIPEVITPKKVVKKMVDLLPNSVWNDKTVFLDTACKGGEYLKEIYDRLMESEYMKTKYPNDIARSTHILKNQLYGIALSKVSFDRTTNKLFGENRNIKIIHNYIERLKDIQKYGTTPYNEKQLTFKGLIEEVFEKEMNIDVVISNPPYQEIKGGGLNDSGGKPLFDKFIKTGLEIAEIVCMITPTKWISGEQAEFISIRRDLTIGNHLRSMVDYFNPVYVFPGTQIAGGVSYFLYDKSYSGEVEFTSKTYVTESDSITNMRLLTTSGIIPRHAVAEKIIKNLENNTRLSSCIHKDLWKLTTSYRGKNVKTNTDDLSVITPSGISYISKSDVTNDLVNEYKVLLSRVVNGSTYLKDGAKKLLSTVKVLKPYEICNNSYMVMGGFGTELEAINAAKYIKTKFTRFLLLQALFGIGLTSDRFKFVPLQNFTSVSDIDWSNSISDIDQQLYRKYNLTPDEITYIESTIKSME